MDGGSCARSSLAYVFLILCLATSVLKAQSGEANQQEGIQNAQGGHVDSRMDFWEYADDEFLVRYAKAVAFHTFTNRLHDEGNGTFSFNVVPWTEDLFAVACPTASINLCPSVRFFGQPIADPWNGSSAFLVGEDLVLVAKHTFGGNNGDPVAICASGRAFIFDHFQYAIRASYPGSNGVVIFPAENVFFRAEAVTWEPSPGVINDWVLVRLDRPVPEKRIPFRIRRQGVAEPGAPASLLGFPDRLPLKLERSAIESAVSGGTVRVPAFVRVGNSGGVIVNEITGKAEGLVRSGPTYLECDEENDCRADPEFTRVASALSFATAKEGVPPVGMQVSPIGPIEHHGPPGGPFTNGEPQIVMGFTYQIDVPLPEPGFLPSRTVDFTVTPDANGLVGVRYPGRGALQTGPISGTLEPGDVRGVVAGLMTPVLNLSAGAYDADIHFFDGAYRASDFRRHRILVGVEGFDVDPDERFAGDGPGAQPDEEKFYSITNKYTVSQQVRVSASDSWIRVDDGPGPVTYNIDPNIILPANGSSGLVPNQPVAWTKLSLDATGLSDGVHVGTVEFVSMFDGQPSPAPVFREVRIDVGRRFFGLPNAPLVIKGLDPVLVPIELPEFLLEVVDLDVALNIEYQDGDVNGLVLGLVSPEGTSITLHEDRLDPGDVLDTVYDDDTNPPYRRNRLADFNGEKAAGTWNLVFDANGGTKGRFELRDFTLRFILAPPGGNS